MVVGVPLPQYQPRKRALLRRLGFGCSGSSVGPASVRFSPDEAESMYVRGRITKIHPNGRQPKFAPNRTRAP
jgi:hypothetical protein